MDEDLWFGRWVKVCCVALGFTQARLAERTRYSTVIIRKIESDVLRPSRQIAEKLAEALVLAPDEQSDFIHHARSEAGAESRRPLSADLGQHAASKVTPHPSIPTQTASLPPFLARQPLPDLPPPIFIEHSRELHELAATPETARCGKGQILFVISGAGRGKTTLVQEFAHCAQQADPTRLAVSGHCNAHTERGDCYLPFREVLATLVGDVEAKCAGGLISTRATRRLWEAMPITVSALPEHAPDIIDIFVLAVANAGQTCGSLRFAGRDLWLVHRGLQYG